MTYCFTPTGATLQCHRVVRSAQHLRFGFVPHLVGQTPCSAPDPLVRPASKRRAFLSPSLPIIAQPKLRDVPIAGWAIRRCLSGAGLGSFPPVRSSNAGAALARRPPYESGSFRRASRAGFRLGGSPALGSFRPLRRRRPAQKNRDFPPRRPSNMGSSILKSSATIDNSRTKSARHGDYCAT